MMTNDMTWQRTWFQLQQQTAATSAKTWLIRWIPCPCFDPYPTTFGLPILGHLEHGRVYFITAPLLKGTRTLLVCNEAVTAHQQQHRHIDNNISIITVRPPLHIPPQKNKLLLQFHNSTSPTKNQHNILDNSHNLSIKQIKTSTSHNAVPWLEDLVFKLIQIDSNHYLVILIRPR